MSFKKKISKSIACALIGVTIATPLFGTASAMELSDASSSGIIQELNESAGINLNESSMDTQDLMRIEQELDKLVEESEQEGKAIPVIVVTVAKWLAGIIGGYLAGKLIDMGAKKWCAKYKYHNWATKAACNFLGF